MIYKSERLYIEKDGTKLYFSFTDCSNIANIIIDYIADDFSKLMSTNIDMDITIKECALQGLKERIDKRLNGLDDLHEALNKHREELK